MGAGKSHIGTRLSELVGWPVAGFGGYVRDVARERGLRVEDRGVLQQIGEELVRFRRERFCRAVLEEARWSAGVGAILHGLRHLEVLDTLRGLVRPVPVLVVHVEAPLALRWERLRARNEQPGATLETHSTEAQLDSAIPAIANLVVSGAEAAETAVDKIARWLAVELA